MTRLNKKSAFKPNIGYEQRVFIRKDGAYYHLIKDCEIFVPNEFSDLDYQEIRISRVPKGILPCPFCVKNNG